MIYNLENKNKIDYLVGKQKILNESAAPYSSNICDFISEFSKELNGNKYSKDFPDIKTL